MQENIIIEELHEDGTVMTPMSEFSAPLQRRILYLKELQKEFEGQEDELNKEMKALEQKYAEIYGQIHAKRAAVVVGEIDAPEHIKPETESISEAATNEPTPQGIPQFWCQAITNCNELADLIQENDEEVLAYLTDVRVKDLYGTEGEDDEDEEGFTLTFEFEENPYFTNKELTKTYHMDDEGLTDTAGCSIDWKPNKNITVKVLKKKAGGKGSKKGARQADKSETKVEQLPSFFHFFSPPTLPEGMTVAPDSLAAAIQEDYELGEAFREEIIPNAVKYFLGEVEQSEEDSDYTDENEDDPDDDDDDIDDNEDDFDSSEDEEPVQRKKKGPKDKVKANAQPADCKQQ